MVNDSHTDRPIPPTGAIVSFPWGLGHDLFGRVVEVYGPPGRPQVLIELSPELSGDIVDESTTVSLPLDAITIASAA